jgi:hypothetical protein
MAIVVLATTSRVPDAVQRPKAMRSIADDGAPQSRDRHDGSI